MEETTTKSKAESNNKPFTRDFEIIPIYWSEPMRFRPDLDSPVDTDLPDGNYVYQVYGHHPVYGLNVLLYIGKTKLLKRRMEEHADMKFLNGLDLTIRVASVYKSDDSEYANNVRLRRVEALLIASIKPAYNSAGLMASDYLQTQSLFMIQNHGSRGALPLECTNFWWRTDEMNGMGAAIDAV